MFNIRKNLPITLGIAIPVVMVLLIMLSVYLPKLMSKPDYNFLFTTGSSYNYYRHVSPASGTNMVANHEFTYEVSGGKLIQNKQTYYYYPNEKPTASSKLFLYAVKEGKSREVTFDEAKKLKLDTNSISPDGYEITNGSRGGGLFPFYYESGSDYNAKYIRKGISSHKLNLPAGTDPYYYYNDSSFRLLGWVVN
jgi:hypothetical protein